MTVKLDVSRRAACAALRHDIPRTAFTLTALSGNAEFKLNFFKSHARTGVTNDFTVGDSMADADDHVMSLLLAELIQYLDYKYESIAFAISFRALNCFSSAGAR